MDNWSKIIFVCLAVGYTLLIYQNNQLKDEINSIKDQIKLKPSSMAVEIENCMELYLSAQQELSDDDLKREQKQNAFKVCSSNYKNK
jgi:hypothetical protein